MQILLLPVQYSTRNCIHAKRWAASDFLKIALISTLLDWSQKSLDEGKVIFTEFWNLVEYWILGPVTELDLLRRLFHQIKSMMRSSLFHMWGQTFRFMELTSRDLTVCARIGNQAQVCDSSWTFLSQYRTASWLVRVPFKERKAAPFPNSALTQVRGGELTLLHRVSPPWLLRHSE